MTRRRLKPPGAPKTRYSHQGTPKRERGIAITQSNDTGTPASGPAIEVGHLIDERPVSGLQIGIVILCALVVFLDGYDIQAMALAVPAVAREWDLPSGSFGLALTAAVAGIGIGAAFVASLGDRWGRRTVLIVSVGLVGLGSIATAFALSLTDLVIWRFLTGLGLGTSVPNAVALTSEYVPARRRAALIALMYCNIAIGAFAAGFIAPVLLEAFGWESIFLAGGIAPLILVLLFIFVAPESLAFLLAKRGGGPQSARVLARLAPDVAPETVYAENRKASGERRSVLALLSPEYRMRTLLLWAVFSLNFFVLYFLISWLPTLLTQAGWPEARALQGAVMIQAGGVAGGLLLAWLVDRGYPARSLAVAYVLTAVSLALFSIIPSTPMNWGILLVIVGGGTSGAQLAVTALAAMFYPALLRATGVGWATAIARLGAVLGPLVGGWIIGLDLAAFQVLAVFTIPVLIAALCVAVLPRVWPKEVAAQA